MKLVYFYQNEVCFSYSLAVADCAHNEGRRREGRGWGFWAGQDHGLDQAGPAVDRKCLKSFVTFGGAG